MLKKGMQEKAAMCEVDRREGFLGSNSKILSTTCLSEGIYMAGVDATW